MVNKVAPEGYRKVAIVGGTGELGKYITREFLSHKELEVTVISRKGSDKKELKEEYKSNGAKLLELDYNNSSELKDALSNIDVLISTISGESLYETQKSFIDAAISSNIKLFIPSEFGTDVEGINDNPFFIPKANLRKYLKEVKLNYIIYSNGYFLEHILSPFYGIDIQKGTASIIGKGETEFTVTSLVDIAKFVYQTYYLPEIVNQTVHINGENTIFKKALKEVSEVTGKPFKIDYIELQRANEILEDKSTDLLTFISHILRREIERGIVKLKGNSNSLVPDFHFTSVKDYAKINFAQ